MDYVSLFPFQGNPPLDLDTRESRENSWNEKKSLPFYISADNVDDLKRSDAAMFYVSAPSMDISINSLRSLALNYSNLSPHRMKMESSVTALLPMEMGCSLFTYVNLR